jgi:hypothetical protein
MVLPKIHEIAGSMPDFQPPSFLRVAFPADRLVRARFEGNEEMT